LLADSRGRPGLVARGALERSSVRGERRVFPERPRSGSTRDATGDGERVGGDAAAHRAGERSAEGEGAVERNLIRARRGHIASRAVCRWVAGLVDLAGLEVREPPSVGRDVEVEDLVL